MNLRSWATPLVIGSFLVMSVTGTLMFFHLESDLNEALHEWAGLAMVAGAGMHVAANWRAFAQYFHRPAARAVMAVFALVLAASFLPFDPEDGRPEPRAMFGALSGAPIGMLAEMTGQDTDAVIARLAANGHAGIEPGQTVRTIAGGDFDAQAAILGSVLANP